MVLVSDNQSSVILKPGKESFDTPSTPITSQLSTVLRFGPFPASTMRGDQFNTPVIKKCAIQLITVVCLIADQLVRSILCKAAINRFLDKLHFMGRSAFNVSGDRKTSSVCDGHDLGALAAFCLADSKTLFFAGTKVPSMKASRISMPPRSYRSCASSWTMRWNTPDRTHCWNRLWQVWYGGYLAGKSFHGAPVRKIHKIPPITSRGSLAGRPLGSFCGVYERIMGSIRFHCSFVSSILIVLHIQNLMSRFF